MPIDYIEEVTEKIRDEVDCRDLASLILQRDGNARGGRIYLCPAHPDSKAGSFTVAKTGCNCFACGYKAGAINLVKTVKRCSFLEAVDFLDNEFNLHLPKRTPPSKDEFEKAEKVAKFEITEDEMSVLCIRNDDILKSLFSDDVKNFKVSLLARCKAVLAVLRKIPAEHPELASETKDRISKVKSVMTKLEGLSEKETTRLVTHEIKGAF